MTNTITNITLDKRTNLHPANAAAVFSGTVAKAVEVLSNSDVDGFLSVTWKVVANAPVSVERQNATMLRRANKIAAGIGRSVEMFDQVDNATYGVVLV